MSKQFTNQKDKPFTSTHKTLKVFAVVSLIFSIVSFLWLIYNFSEYLQIEHWLSKPEHQAMFVFYGIVLIFFTHLLSLFTILMALKILKDIRIVGNIALLFGALSFIWLFADYASLIDIVREYPDGYDIHYELSSLFLGVGLHGIFFLSFFILLFKVLISLRDRGIIPSTVLGENIFIAMNLVGIVCAMIGLLATWWEYHLNVSPDARKWAVLPQMVFIMTPYLIVFLSWLLRAMRDRNSGLCDEKQRHDVIKAGITTWIVSIPVMTFVFLWSYQNISGPGSILWFPAYIFVTVLIFSFSSLLYFKRA